MKTKIIGLTGGIATGKSSVLNIFRKLGAKTIDADDIVRKLYRKESVKEVLVLNFGGNAVSGNGTVNRQFLAKKIFSDRKSRLLLNALVHPLVNAEIRKRVEAFRKAGKKSYSKNKKTKNKKTKNKSLLVVEAPLLFESGSEKMYGNVVVVSSTRKKQLERMRKGGISKKDAEKRLAVQMPIGEKIKKADFVVDNNAGKKELETGVKKVLAKLVFRKPPSKT
jgi:dephospho-CoA kinase